MTGSTHDLEKEYQGLKRDIINLRKLHRTCEPCNASTKVRDGCDCTALEPRKDCLDFYQNGYKISGVYRLKRPGFQIIRAYCDQTTQGGG